MSEKSTLVDVDEESLEEQTEAHAELSFQDFPHDYDADGSDRKEKSQTHNFTDFPHNAGSDDEEGDKVELLEADRKPPSFWSFDYYQQFFDVDTVEVLQRIWGSMLPLPKRNFLRTKIRPNPDLYGPFWICATLVFTTAIAGNLSNYLQTAGKDYHWNYEFNKVTVAATAIYCYWWLVPTALFGVLWWRGSQAGYGFLEIICVYGYSLAIYIPISILWVINVAALQWTLVILGACLSGGVLLLTFWPAVREDNKKIAVAIMVGIFIFHALLASGFLFYFFRVSSPQSSVTPSIKPLVNNTEHIRGEADKEDFETAVENHPKQTLADITVRPPATTLPEKVHSDIGEKTSSNNALEKPKEEENLTTDNKNLPSHSKDVRRKRHLAQR